MDWNAPARGVHAGGPPVEWDLGSMTRKVFRRRFKAEIEFPLQDLLERMQQNPNLQVQPSPLLCASIEGLTMAMNENYREGMLARRYQSSQAFQNAFGSQGRPHVSYLSLQSLSQVRNYCMRIIDPAQPPSNAGISWVGLDDIIATELQADIFAHHRYCLGMMARPGVSVALFFSWQIPELGLFFGFPSEVPFIRTRREMVTPRTPQDQFFREVLADEALNRYMNEYCAFCGNAGVHRTYMNLCSSCQVARYCSEECRDMHWPVHRPHCTRLRALKRDQTIEENYRAALAAGDERFQAFQERLRAALVADDDLRPYAANVCAHCNTTAVHKCALCDVARYCGRQHQVAHWRAVHQLHCERLREVNKTLKEELFGED